MKTPKLTASRLFRLKSACEKLTATLGELDDVLWLPWAPEEDARRLTRITKLRDKLIDVKLRLHAERPDIVQPKPTGPILGFHVKTSDDQYVIAQNNGRKESLVAQPEKPDMLVRRGDALRLLAGWIDSGYKGVIVTVRERVRP